MPVFNEEAYLPASLRSLAAQTQPFRLILVDNGSTDASPRIAHDIAASAGIDMLLLEESRPGQVHALARGTEAATTELIAICDADTRYPPHYLARAEALFDARGPDCVAAAAWLRPESGGQARAAARALHQLAAARLMPRQNHTSGAAHCFRAAALRAAGGYDPARWPYVLKDHELMHRVLQQGSQAWHPDLWCISSERRRDRTNVRWTLAERLAYHVTPFSRKTAFFRDFLAPRFAARRQQDSCLRHRDWSAAA